MRVVLDTSVLVSAMRSQRGASYRLIRSLPSPQFQPVLSISLYTEWQSVLTRPEHLPHGVSTEQMLSFLRYLASLAHPQDIYYLWRPFLRDPNDDMVLECAIASGSRYIITHNVRDFQRAQLLGPQPLTPADFLNHLEQSS
ncbi:MAG: putative toxin-antitoxin system toxin component, PIN family [Lautropia mirabilis]|jgi:probable toxin-antitoxin system toxin component, PIN family|nr:putative toxin-antitoxin system toxin component, PIN family [Lautropia mirabilis]